MCTLHTYFKLTVREYYMRNYDNKNAFCGIELLLKYMTGERYELVQSYHFTDNFHRNNSICLEIVNRTPLWFEKHPTNKTLNC